MNEWKASKDSNIHIHFYRTFICLYRIVNECNICFSSVSGTSIFTRNWPTQINLATITNNQNVVYFLHIQSTTKMRFNRYLYIDTCIDSSLLLVDFRHSPVVEGRLKLSINDSDCIDVCSMNGWMPTLLDDFRIFFGVLLNAFGALFQMIGLKFL